MKRREILAFVGAGMGLPAITRAQTPGRTYRIGFLVPVPMDDPAVQNVLDGLNSQGFVLGKNLQADPHGFGLRPDQVAAAARQLTEAKVDLMLAGGAGAIKAAQAASRSIAIAGVSEDMVGEGRVSSLANHDGNTTGISILATELDGKRQEILMELLPEARRIAILADTDLTSPAYLEALQKSAVARGIELSVQKIAKSEDVGPALEQAKAEGAAGINTLSSPSLFGIRALIFAKATALRLPTMFQWSEAAKEGAAIAYGPSSAEVFRRWGQLGAKLLRGTKASDIPVEQPTTFKLAINLKLARQLGIPVPAPLLQRADEVVE